MSLLLALWACAAEPVGCAVYSDPSLRGWCEARAVSAGQAPVERCAQAGPYAAHCRTRWVERAVEDPSWSFETLISACGDSPDCRFVVLDRRPHAELGEQMERCARWAGPYAGSCQIHAAQSFAGSLPDPERVRRALEHPQRGAWRGPLGAALGQLVLCAGARCEDFAGSEADCADAVAHLEHRADLCERR